ncbi:MAG: spore coat protein YlbD [Bacilli bacterium]|nr:spore coat protein YlbD [Bacilli bacterium]
MATKEKFKEFVKNNPILLKYIKNGKMTWQKFYEIYDMYGENEEAWSEFFTKDDLVKTTSGFDLVSFVKNLDLDGIQNGVNSIQRVLSLFQDMSKEKNKPQDVYKPRPIYKHFDD